MNDATDVEAVHVVRVRPVPLHGDLMEFTLAAIGGPECGNTVTMVAADDSDLPEQFPDDDPGTGLYVRMREQPDWMVVVPQPRPARVIYVWEPLYFINA